MSDEAAEEPVVPAAADGGAEPPEEGPPEPGFPAVPPPGPTGDPRVDAALARLAELGGRPVPAHVEVFEDVHQRLQEILAAAGEEERPRPAFPDALRPSP